MNDRTPSYIHRPAREESFDQLRGLVDGNRLGEAGLWGWEARAELSVRMSCAPLRCGHCNGMAATTPLPPSLPLELAPPRAGAVA